MDTTIIVDSGLWSLLVGFLVPVVVAIATKLRATSGLKAFIGIVLSIIGGVVITLDQITPGGSFSWRLLIFTAATAIITQVTTYLGAWKPVVALNTKTAPNFGLGTDATV